MQSLQVVRAEKNISRSPGLLGSAGMTVAEGEREGLQLNLGASSDYFVTGEVVSAAGASVPTRGMDHKGSSTR